MRNAFATAIYELAISQDDVILLVGDIGNKLFDNLKKINLKKFINCGISESNMTGVASGLAMNGFNPFTYTIAPFNTYRCFEQIRIDICYQNLPVTIVGTGAGLSYSSLGSTHHSMEDIAIMRTLPNLKIVCPADPIEVNLAVKAAYHEKGPVYIRLGKKGEPIIHSKEPNFNIGKVIELKKGKDITFLSVGNIMALSMECIELLEKKNIDCGLVSLHTVKPLDEVYLKQLFKYTNKIIVLEEHGFIGGSLAALVEFSFKEKLDTNKIIGFKGPENFISCVGNQENARKEIGLISTNIINKVIESF